MSCVFLLGFPFEFIQCSKYFSNTLVERACFPKASNYCSCSSEKSSSSQNSSSSGSRTRLQNPNRGNVLKDWFTKTVFSGQFQTERAFQKQPFINLNRKVKPTIVKKKSLRRHRDVGLGFKTPREVFHFMLLDISILVLGSSTCIHFVGIYEGLLLLPTTLLTFAFFPLIRLSMAPTLTKNVHSLAMLESVDVFWQESCRN